MIEPITKAANIYQPVYNDFNKNWGLSSLKQAIQSCTLDILSVLYYGDPQLHSQNSKSIDLMLLM